MEIFRGEEKETPPPPLAAGLNLGTIQVLRQHVEKCQFYAEVILEWPLIPGRVSSCW